MKPEDTRTPAMKQAETVLMQSICENLEKVLANFHGGPTGFVVLTIPQDGFPRMYTNGDTQSVRDLLSHVLSTASDENRQTAEQILKEGRDFDA